MKKKLLLVCLFVGIFTTSFSADQLGNESKYLAQREAGDLKSLTEEASKNNEIAIRMIGEGYEIGNFGVIDYEKAMSYYETSVKMGGIRSLTNIGLMYYKGLGVKQDYKKAFEYLQKADEGDDMKAPRYLGLYYEKGIGGVKINYYMAAYYYQKAANSGDITSQYYLGNLYEKGLGVPQNYDIAMKWYLISSERGDMPTTPAMIAIGSLYEKGLGIEKNINNAIHWYEKAAKVGNKDAKKILDNLK